MAGEADVVGVEVTKSGNRTTFSVTVSHADEGWGHYADGWGVVGPDGTVLAFAIFSADEGTRKRISKANREAPQGARSYNKRAKRMQQKLIERWGALYGA